MIEDDDLKDDQIKVGDTIVTLREFKMAEWELWEKATGITQFALSDPTNRKKLEGIRKTVVWALMKMNKDLTKEDILEHLGQSGMTGAYGQIVNFTAPENGQDLTESN